MRRLHPTQPTSHALPGIPGATSLYFVGSRGGRLQAGRHHTLEARRHALDGPRRQCHPRSTLLSPQRTLRGLLGTPRGAEGRMTLSTFMSHTRVARVAKLHAESFREIPSGTIHPPQVHGCPAREP